ncbi:Gfo/Idh/MocA family oxidoreductase [candidate division KSB1 bacterium]|nr:Gfo/Idh/MocA family oxidoreductase [candidate division KSB1 bacterium]
MNRRTFLKSSVTIPTFTIVSRHVLGGPGYTAPSDKLNIAGIGIGGQGAWDLEECAGENIVALCDVDAGKAAEQFKKYPRAKRYRDFRIMLEKERSIDAVIIATPDHTHAVAAMASIRAGKHVYCEKPLTHTIYEARAVTQAAREAGVITQMGNQGMASEGNRLIKEWLNDGAIGPVREVHVWSDRPTRLGTSELWWPQGINKPAGSEPAPPSLDWDLWLGPATSRPYHSAYGHFVWHGWWDFGAGGLGDMGIHNIAPAFDALKLTAPTCVHASSTPVFPDTLPVASVVHYDFPARNNMPPVKLNWYDGGLLPQRPVELEDDRELPKEDGLIFIGEKGAMLVHGWGGESPRLIPETKMQAYTLPPKTLPRSIGHHAEWIKACKQGTSTMSNFDFAGPLTEAVLLGTISIRMGGKKLYWDSEKLSITNSEEANRYVHYNYRDGWEL